MRGWTARVDSGLATGSEAVPYASPRVYNRRTRCDRDAAKGQRPGLPLSYSAYGVAEYREFERFSDTVSERYLQPLMDVYLAGSKSDYSAA